MTAEPNNLPPLPDPFGGFGLSRMGKPAAISGGLPLQNHLYELERIENEVAAAIRATHARELAVVDDALHHIIIGFNDYSSQKGSPDNRLESARIFLAIRSFNSLRTARQILERGYYQQAMTLVRMAMEDQLVAEDAEAYPPTLDALLDGNGKIGRRDLALNKMAERISPKAKEAWDNAYSFASEYAAHPRERSLRGLLSTGPEGQINLQAGSNYDEVEVNAVLCYLLRELVFVMHTTAKLTAGAGSDWAERSTWLLRDITCLRQRIDDWGRQKLEEPEE